MNGVGKVALRRGSAVSALALVLGAGACLAPAAYATPGTGFALSIYAGTPGSAGGITPGPATASRLSLVQGDALDAAGNLYVADPFNSIVERITANGQISVFAGTQGTNGTPTPGPATGTYLNQPSGVAADSAGNVYISDGGDHEVDKVDAAGNISVFAGTGSSGLPQAGPAANSHLNTPQGVATDAAGDVYIADTLNRVVEKVTPSGELSIIAGVPGSSGAPTPGPATSSKLGEPDAVTVDAAGNVDIADSAAHVIEKVTPSGQLSILAGQAGTSAAPTPGPATASHLEAPYGVAVDSAGDVYVADAGSDSTVDEITPDGALSVIAGTTGHGSATPGPAASSQVNQPDAVAVGTNGDLYLSDSFNFTIDRLVPAAPTSTATPAISGTPQPGQTLSATAGSWTAGPFTESYAWKTCDASGTGCTAIPTATGNTYAVTAADVGHTLRIAVTATNGGGSSTATSAPTAAVAGDAITATTTTTALPPTATPVTPPVRATTNPAGTGSATVARSQSARLAGEISPSTTPVTYHFQYGHDRNYRHATGSRTVPASRIHEVVHANIDNLVPGTVYHYRLVITTSSGNSEGQDETLRTPRATAHRLRDHITPQHQSAAPYRYRLHGRIVPALGLTRSQACRSGGTATVTVTADGAPLTTRHVPVHRDCTYDLVVRFTAGQLPGSGRLLFHIAFAGNQQIRARRARTLAVLYGPAASQ
jgi:NHL repeat